MSRAIRATSAKERAQIAAKYIRSGRDTSNSRGFSDCFEMGDGDQVIAHLREMVKHSPKLAANISKYLVGFDEPRMTRWCGTCKQDVPLLNFSSDKMRWCRACNREMVKRKYWKRQLLAHGPSVVQTEIISLAKRIAWLQNLLDSQTGT